MARSANARATNDNGSRPPHDTLTSTPQPPTIPCVRQHSYVPLEISLSPVLQPVASMEGAPFGWTHRHNKVEDAHGSTRSGEKALTRTTQRSHDEMERPAATAWSFDHLDNGHNHNHNHNHTHDHSRAREPSAPFRRTPSWYDLNIDFGTQSQRAFDSTPRFRSHYEPLDVSSYEPAAPTSTSALQNNARAQNMASTAPQRFEGDGYDYRRPVVAASATVDLTREDEDEDEDEDDELELDMEMDFDEENEVDFGDEQDIIDLTADDSGYGASQDEGPALQDNSGEQASDRPRRLPRGMDIIIDLDNGDEEWTVATPQPEPGSPDIEFISSRPIFPARRNPRPQPQPHPHSNSDEVEFVRANPLPQEELRRRRNQELDNVLDLLGTMNGRFNHLRAQVDRFNAQVNRTADRFRRTPVALPRNAARVRVGAFMAPDLNFDMVGFDLGFGARAEPPPPTYDAPEKAPEGFTRSPQEEDVLVCPNCGDELCCGQDDLKKQVWVVKNCGHVYCGECTANRSSKRSAKGKERTATTKPFKECQVDGCGKSVTNRKAMVQIFM